MVYLFLILLTGFFNIFYSNVQFITLTEKNLGRALAQLRSTLAQPLQDSRLVGIANLAPGFDLQGGEHNPSKIELKLSISLVLEDDNISSRQSTTIRNLNPYKYNYVYRNIKEK